ncbi:MAG: hypothetical protein KF889_19335 [Alphaproteobacteria bacterium]|nr:hypothetical protein [Alphaproteobacteria bacterium]MCW5744071.1 hypothetical protein [Alphaproteobacteria bacterium]
MTTDPLATFIAALPHLDAQALNTRRRPERSEGPCGIAGIRRQCVRSHHREVLRCAQDDGEG